MRRIRDFRWGEKPPTVSVVGWVGADTGSTPRESKVVSVARFGAYRMFVRTATNGRIVPTNPRWPLYLAAIGRYDGILQRRLPRWFRAVPLKVLVKQPRLPRVRLRRRLATHGLGRLVIASWWGAEWVECSRWPRSSEIYHDMQPTGCEVSFYAKYPTVTPPPTFLAVDGSASFDSAQGWAQVAIDHEWITEAELLWRYGVPEQLLRSAPDAAVPSDSPDPPGGEPPQDDSAPD